MLSACLSEGRCRCRKLENLSHQPYAEVGPHRQVAAVSRSRPDHRVWADVYAAGLTGGSLPCWSASCPLVRAGWVMLPTLEQYRLSGKLSIVSADSKDAAALQARQPARLCTAACSACADCTPVLAEAAGAVGRSA